MPARPGPIDGEGQRADGQAERTQGQQAVFHLRRRQLARQQATQADADPQRGQRQAALPIRSAPGASRRKPGSAAAPGWRSSRRRSGRSRPGASTRSALIDSQAIRTVVAQPPLGPGGLDRRDRQGRQQAAGRENRQDQAAQPRVAADQIENDPAPPRCRPGSPGSTSSPAGRCRPRAAREARSRAGSHTWPARRTRSELRADPARRSTASPPWG